MTKFPRGGYTTHHAIHREAEGGYHAMCPTLPGCHSEADTLDEAVINIREAIAVYIESMIAHGETPPIEDILIKPLDIAAAV